MSQHVNVRLDELLAYLREGRIMEAMNEFYAENVTMEDPSQSTHGLAANIERERSWMDSIKEVRNFQVPRVATGSNTAMYENIMDWTDKEGHDHHLEQVAVQTWKNGKIIHERFYFHA
jgi:hypothetical protein